MAKGPLFVSLLVEPLISHVAVWKQISLNECSPRRANMSDVQQTFLVKESLRPEAEAPRAI